MKQIKIQIFMIELSGTKHLTEFHARQAIFHDK